MKVTISVYGKFHAFHLARELERRDYLCHIFTSYPYFKIKEERVSKGKITCLVLEEILQRLIYKVPYIKRHSGIQYYLSHLYDLQVSRLIKPCDIFVGWSGFSLCTIRKMRKTFPAKVVLERGSTHIEYQRDVLIEEQERKGIKLILPPPRIVDKELEEYRETDYISLPSTLAEETFLNKGFSEEKLIRVPLGVDIDAFRPIPKEDNIFRIILTGISVLKGVHYFLQAIDELKLKNLEAWLIGRVSNDIRPLLKRYSGNVKYMGGVPHKELYKYYSQGSAFVLFSLEDGFGMVVLEAMACGLPVICSTGTGSKDVVTEGVDGFVVPTRDIERLKEKIIYLYRHPSVCKEMGEQARRKVESNFTWKHYGARIIAAYLNLLK